MKKRNFAIIFAALFIALSSISTYAVARSGAEDDTDTRFVNAKVTEVTDGHISVMAQTGVEHVIAIDRKSTKVTIDGREVSLKDLREGDIITVELDAKKPVKFARNISMRSAQQSEVARNRR